MSSSNTEVKILIKLESSNIDNILIQFNFCPVPLNKLNIIRINFEVENDYTLKKCLLKAIENFNKLKENIKIVKKTNLYKIRLGKKSGLPDNDLPSKKFYIYIYNYNF